MKRTPRAKSPKNANNPADEAQGNESELEPASSCTLIVQVDSVRTDTAGRLTVDGESLEVAEGITAAFFASQRTASPMGQIGACDGSYRIGFCWRSDKQAELGGIEDPTEAFMRNTARRMQAVSENAQLANPKAASDMGISDEELALLEKLSLAKEMGLSVSIARNDGGQEHQIDLDKDFGLDSLPTPVSKPTAVTGRVTGASTTADGAVQVRINHQSSLIDTNLSESRACELYKGKARVSGIQVKKDKVLYIETAVYHMDGQKPLGI
jgi:hypothetical protein